ncbi:hypothetical protein B484DRAFT_401346 [Ochromonadaceae sp. CCMP2298]|nr:hypothetical protein B484DRAFT_401346 [Ochromonadaceae sp. CCMP2298]
MPSSGACPDPSTPPIVEAEAEAEAEAVEAEAEAEAEAAGASEEAMVEVVSNRTLFWRSGHYSAVLLHSPPSQWKLQVAGRPEKVWFFDLSADPTERHNLAPALGVTCRWDLDVLLLSDALMGQPSQSQQQPEQEQQQEQQQLVRAYRTLKALEREQREPLWPALSETPLRIDVMQLQPWSAPAPGGPERGVGTCAGAKEEEELVYWCN